jgi:putative membrane protein
VYGAIAEVWPSAGNAWGLPFGAALWLGADQAVVPALGFGSKPSDTRAPMHGWAFGAHLIYGLAADTVRRTVRAMMQRELFGLRIDSMRSG